MPRVIVINDITFRSVEGVSCGGCALNGRWLERNREIVGCYSMQNAVKSLGGCGLEGWQPVGPNHDPYRYAPRHLDSQEEWSGGDYRVFDKFEKWKKGLGLDFSTHPGVEAVLRLGDGWVYDPDFYKFHPKDMGELVLEEPQGTDTKVRYYRSRKDKEAGRQTETSLGRYLRRHFQRISDDKIRDVVARSHPAEFEFVEDIANMVSAKRNGPWSCMRWKADVDIEYDHEAPDKEHPYNVYRPEFGWKMAVKIQGGKITGVALCLDDGEEKGFVRSYEGTTDDRSDTDYALEAWLEEQGYTKIPSWPVGTKIAAIPHPQRDEYEDFDHWYLLPYIDGGNRNVTEDRDGALVVCEDEDALWKCDWTCGGANCLGTLHRCDCCGSVGLEATTTTHEGNEVCVECLNSHYTEVFTSQGTEYVKDDNLTYGEDGQQYLAVDLPDDMILMQDGRIVPQDEVFVAVDGTLVYKYDIGEADDPHASGFVSLGSEVFSVDELVWNEEESTWAKSEEKEKA